MCLYKVPFFFSDFNETRIFFYRFVKNTQISNFMKILLVEDELFCADGRTDIKLTVAFRNFAKRCNDFLDGDKSLDSRPNRFTPKDRKA
jgi:hypothetical protein